MTDPAASPDDVAAHPAAAGGAGALLRLRSLMHAQGLACDLARLGSDPTYALERIVAAQGAAHAGLRGLALELFQIIHGRAGAGPARR